MQVLEDIIATIASLLGSVAAISQICPVFSEICAKNPKSALVGKVFTDTAHEIVKKNMVNGIVLEGNSNKCAGLLQIPTSEAILC